MTNRKIKILFIIDYFHRTGGTEKHLTQLIECLPAETFHCSVVVFDLGENPLLAGLRARGIPIFHLPVGSEYVPNAAVQAFRLWRLVRGNKYDIVQTFHQKADTYGALVAWLSGVNYLISSKRDMGDLRNPLHMFLNRRMRFLFSAFIAVANEVRVAVMASDHLLPSRVTTIYNGVDTEHFGIPSAAQRADARVRLGFGDDDWVVGVVASFRPEKNHDVLLSGLLKALPSIPSLRILLVGSGPLLAQVRKEVAQADLSSRALFTGDVADVLPYLWAMDVGCLTSGRNEGLSNAVIEQMAVGLPMIVSAVGGNAEAVLDGETGCVIPPFDATALCGAAVALYGDPVRAASMGLASRARVEEHFSLRRMCSAHVQLYLELLGVPCDSNE